MRQCRETSGLDFDTLFSLYSRRTRIQKLYRLEINIFVPLHCLASAGLLHLSLYLESQISWMVTAWSGFCVFQWENDLWLICNPCTGYLHAGWDQSLLTWAVHRVKGGFLWFCEVESVGCCLTQEKGGTEFPSVFTTGKCLLEKPVFVDSKCCSYSRGFENLLRSHVVEWNTSLFVS